MTGRLDPVVVWRLLPARMPGRELGALVSHLPGATVGQVVQVVEEMVARGWVMRRHRKGRDVYYRGLPPKGESECSPNADPQLALFPPL